MKRCSECGEVKLLSDFYTRKDRNYAPISRCKSCIGSHRRGNPDYAAARQKWYQKDLDRSREYVRQKARKRNYARVGITIEQYNRMLAQQGGVCAICKVKPSRKRPTGTVCTLPHVDHCHDTGVIRGLLCTKCNQGIGLFDHSEATLVAAADYLSGREEAKAV